MRKGLSKMSVQATTISASTAETTIVPAGPAGTNNTLSRLIITTANVVAATLTLRDSTGGTIRAVFDYPNAAVAPGAPLNVPFDPPLKQAAPANNWTLTASVNAASYHVTAVYSEA